MTAMLVVLGALTFALTTCVSLGLIQAQARHEAELDRIRRLR